MTNKSEYTRKALVDGLLTIIEKADITDILEVREVILYIKENDKPLYGMLMGNALLHDIFGAIEGEAKEMWLRS